MENISKLNNDDAQQNKIRPSNSYLSRQNSVVIASSEGTLSGIQKVTDGLLWKLVKGIVSKEINQNFKVVYFFTFLLIRQRIS